jgi:hypothetical protein
MHAQRSLWFGALLLSATLAACLGRGSSGFDISENSAISHVLDTQQCLDRQGLTICPADQIPTPPATPSEPPVTETPGTMTPTPGASPTTPHEQIGRIDTIVGDSTTIACTQSAPDAACRLSFGFTPRGRVEGATYRIAIRTFMPDMAWQVGAEPMLDAGPTHPAYVAHIEIPLTNGLLPVRVQFTVLVFVAGTPVQGGLFAALADTGADYAFVTPEVSLDVQHTFPSPSPGSDGTPAAIGGPEITYFGVARADELALTPAAYDREGRPIYVRPTGQGMFLVIEARPGSSGHAPGTAAFNAEGGLPDLQLLVSHALGDGSAAVCAGGVPGTEPLVFAETTAVIDAVNDIGCRANDGANRPIGRVDPGQACTRADVPGGFGYGFVDSTSTIQFCVPIERSWAFALGDTFVAARVRDITGRVGLTQQIVVRVAARTPTPSPTEPTATPTPSRPPAAGSVTPAPTETAAPPRGPEITYFGVTRADYVPIDQSGVDTTGRPIFVRLAGSGMALVVEARPGPDRRRPGVEAYDPAGSLPDLQMVVSQPLGNGSPAVCDRTRPNIGGVPATVPLEFSEASTVVSAINDLGCRANDGTGAPRAITNRLDACTRPDLVTGEFAFVDDTTTAQFCVAIAAAWAFPVGDTIVAVRVRDTAGALSAVHELVVRIEPTPPTPTRTGFPTTPTPTDRPPQAAGPEITYLGVARADDVPLDPVAVDAAERPVYRRASGSGITLIIEARPGTGGQPVGQRAFDEGGALPDLQIVLSRPIGNGSTTVCDKSAPELGGVPGFDPPRFADDPAIIDAINDLGCRVNDGAGMAVGRVASSACTRPDTSGEFRFVDPASTIQYCLPIARPWAFPMGETIVSARVRDSAGVVGPPREMVVRVQP